LGEILNYNDTVLGYDLEALNVNELVAEEMQGSKKDIPDLVLVRKSYPKYRRKERERYWKLKHLNMQTDEGELPMINEDGHP